MLDGAEPEGFVLDYRASDRTAKLLPVERKLFGVRIEIDRIVIGKQAQRIRIKLVVPEKSKDGAAELIGSALVDD